MSKQRPFRFGVLYERMDTRERLLRTARRAEELSYSTFLIRDHFIPDPFGPQFAPMPTLMAVAGATETLRVGSLVLDNDYRHPVVLAQEAATLDLLSGGRFELGIGAGWLREEYDRAGMAFDAPGIRVDRLEESLRILKGLFAAEPLTYSGRHYAISDMVGFPPPIQQPHPPILVGAGSKRMLMLAAREADIIGILPKALPVGDISDDVTERLAPTITKKVAWIKEAAGDRFQDLELSTMATIQITDDRRRQAEEVRVKRGWNDVSVEQVLDMPAHFIGTVEEIVEQMLVRRETYGFSYYVVTDSNMELAAPIVAHLR